MRTKYSLMSTVPALAVLLAACGGQATPPPNIQNPVDTVAASNAVQTVQSAAESTAVQTSVVQNVDSVVAALQAAGLTVEQGEAVNQPFFTVPGQTFKINGQDVQVFVFDTAQAMKTEAAQISADASTIGTNMPTWMSDPHFYKLGNMLVLYVGQDQKILDILSGILGPQFAGR
jgi:hypothetical protein